MDIKTIMFEEGDFLLLCSDGLSNKVSEKEMSDILTNEDHFGCKKQERLFRLPMIMAAKITLPLQL